ncbi:DUF2975 domain-containing protein [Exilibacterium tricleocarpae]|uniref:DUF2975 domain-containing protein n=1 Tax=Exilibacterium tricleocarpae TaxID=2591008 RepID=A0A545U5B0_9GAMM|nr:DUF2975 domain-containing protein [Exilibacterium tricleocarpae]TQV84652.1 DUF2975 domain-containing protein [Exilibacterium tricleocarpae]
MPVARYRLAEFLALITLLAAIALPLSAAAIWLFWTKLAPFAAGNLGYAFDLTHLGVGARLAGFALALLGAVVQAYGLLGLRQTFQEAVAGRSLSARAVNGFRRFAWVTLAMVFIGIVQRTGWIVIFSLSDPTHQGTLDIRLGSEELQALFMGLLLVFVAHVFAEGKQAKDENAAFL